MLDRSRTCLPLNQGVVPTPRRMGGLGVVLTSLLLAIGVLSIAVPTRAATYTISADETCNGGCTLITDINAGNGSATDDVIDLGGHTITITAAYDNSGNPSGNQDSGLPDIADAASAGKLIIENGTITRDSAAPQFRILYVDSGADLTLDHVTLEHGHALNGADGVNLGEAGTSGSDGGAIYNNGTLTLSNSTLSANRSGAGGAGADASNAGGTGGNSGNGGNGGNGGAVYNNGGTLTLTNSTLAGNQTGAGGGAGVADAIGGNGGEGGSGSAIYSNGGTITSTSSVFSGNGCGGGGRGGVALGHGGNGGNGGSGGAIYNDGSLTLTGSSFSTDHAGAGGSGGVGFSLSTTGGPPGGNGGNGGSGGAIYNDGTLKITRSTLSANRAGAGQSGGVGGNAGNGGKGGDGGAVYSNNGSVTLANSTLTGNQAGDGGDGVFNGSGGNGGDGGAMYTNGSTLILSSATLSDDVAGKRGAAGGVGAGVFGNSGKGTAIYSSGLPTLDGSLVSGKADVCAGFTPPANGQYNLITDASCGTGSLLAGSAKTTAGALNLGTLQNNGGPTQTIALLSGSVAIDAVPTNVCPTTTDQRGVLRPQGSACDAGAYELDTTAPTVASTNLQATYAVPGPSSFTVTFSEPVADTGSGGGDSVTNPANYLLVEAGGNKAFDTLACSGGVVSDDTEVPVSDVTYDSGTMTATVTLGAPLPLGTYRLFVCGTTSITDIAGNKLNVGSDSTFDFAVVAITAIPALSFTGLAILALLLAGAGLALRRRL